MQGLAWFILAVRDKNKGHCQVSRKGVTVSDFYFKGCFWMLY
jgi:hypothetical protein